MKESYLNIELSKHFENQINSRTSISSFLKEKITTKNVILNFQDIEFVSRACAHEILAFLDLFSPLNIRIQNTSLEVQEMLNTVKKSKKSNIKIATTVNRITFNSDLDLYSYLQAI
jgi:hypothetical protein